MRDLLRVEPIGLGLDAAPLDRESMRAMVVGGGQREVLIEQLVLPAGRTAGVAIGDVAGLAFEPPPVVEPIAAFHLMGRGGAAPDEAGGETKGRTHGSELSK